MHRMMAQGSNEYICFRYVVKSVNNVYMIWVENYIVAELSSSRENKKSRKNNVKKVKKKGLQWNGYC